MNPKANPNAPIPPALAALLDTAERRRRMARLQQALTRVGVVVAASALAGGAALLWQPKWITAWPVAAGVAGGALIITALGAWLLPVNRKALLRELDGRLNLPDSLLSAAELAAAEANAWTAAQQEAALKAAESQTRDGGWNLLWPLPWPRESALTMGVLLAMGTLFSSLYTMHFATSYDGLAALGNPRRATALEQLFKDWEERAEAPEEAEAMKTLMAELAPLRERLQDPKASEESVFSDLNQLEDVVKARRAELEARSLEPHAAEMAAALEPMEGMSAMSAALRRGDFASARDHAEKMAAQLGREGAEVPKGAADAAQKMASMADQLSESGHQQASNAMRQLCEGGKKGNCQQMQKGMQDLEKALAQQCQSNGECDRLGAQLAQLAAMRSALSQGKTPSQIQSLAQMMGDKGKGIGSTAGGDLFGEETALNAQRHAEQLSGTVGDEGDSTKTTLQSQTGSATTAQREVAQADFRTYEQLSRQAIEDESIPAAHRQSIREYFERIRPVSEPSHR